MKFFFILYFAGIFSILCAGCATTIIGTGGTGGMYYPTGKAICKIVNKGQGSHGIKCTAKITKGSVDNLKALESGDLQFGIAKSDRIYQAYQGLDIWEGKPLKRLRTIFSAHSESVHLLADSSLDKIEDLKGKSVGIGNPESRDKLDALAVLNAFEIKLDDINELSLNKYGALELFKKGQLDAFFYTVGDPSDVIKAAIDARKANIIPIEGLKVDDMIIRYPYFNKTEILVRWYPRVKNKVNVPTFGYKTIFFASAETPEEIVYSITKELFSNIEQFKKEHPAYEGLSKQSMVNFLDRLAPIHPGALRYYKEVGLK